MGRPGTGGRSSSRGGRSWRAGGTGAVAAISSYMSFAHYLDGLDGDVDGTPPSAGREQEQTWYRVTEAEYRRLVGQARRKEVTLLDHYGASNRAEFFAVASECFFEQPQAMRREHEELYGVLRDFYRQDPAQWLPDAAISGDHANIQGVCPQGGFIQAAAKGPLGGPAVRKRRCAVHVGR